jgi:hypothetical protein
MWRATSPSAKLKKTPCTNSAGASPSGAARPAKYPSQQLRMPRARNASVATSEKVTVAIGSTSSNMRWTLACECDIGRHLLWS